MHGTKVVGALLLALSLSACGIRAETPDPVWPSPDSITQQRDALAAAAQAVIESAAQEPGEDATSAAIASAAATSQLDALGGVYVAYPNGDPAADAAESPSASASPAPLPTLDEAIADLVVVAADVEESALDPELALMARSMRLYYAWFDWYFSAERPAAADADADSPAATPTPAAAPTPAAEPEATQAPLAAPPVPSQLDPALLTDLVLTHDMARFAFVTFAAIETGDARTTALAQAAAHAARADELVAALPSGTADPRTPVYQITAEETATAEARAAFVDDLEGTLAADYLAAFASASASDAEWTFGAALDSLASRSLVEGFDPASVAALPGLEVLAAV